MKKPADNRLFLYLDQVFFFHPALFLFVQPDLEPLFVRPYYLSLRPQMQKEKLFGINIIVGWWHYRYFILGDNSEPPAVKRMNVVIQIAEEDQSRNAKKWNIKKEFAE